jgi:heptosyltransferase-2
MTVSSTHLSFPSRIVVRGTNWVGDTIMSLPAARALRRLFPSSFVAFWVTSSLAPLVKATGIPNEVISFDGNSNGPLRRPFLIRGQLTAGGFDMAVLFQNAFESAFTAWIAGIPIRVGYPTDLRGPLLTAKVPLTEAIRNKHQVFYYLGITEFLERSFGGQGSSYTGSPDCSIHLSRATLDQAKGLLSALGVDLGRPFFCLCPGSVNSETKRWPGDCFARLADLLAERMAAQVVFLGSPQEQRLVEEIISLMRAQSAVNLAGKADMIGSMALMNQSAIVVSNDTGSAHLAVAASAKVLTIFGPTSPGATAPFGPNAHIIQGSADCAPCR